MRTFHHLITGLWSMAIIQRKLFRFTSMKSGFVIRLMLFLPNYGLLTWQPVFNVLIKIFLRSDVYTTTRNPSPHSASSAGHMCSVENSLWRLCSDFNTNFAYFQHNCDWCSRGAGVGLQGSIQGRNVSLIVVRCDTKRRNVVRKQQPGDGARAGVEIYQLIRRQSPPPPVVHCSLRDLVTCIL